MKKYTIAFDCDGTLIKNGATKDENMVANEGIRAILIYKAKKLKFVNVRLDDGTVERRKVQIMVWSGGGELWARQVARAIGVHHYVDVYAAKNIIGRDENGHPQFLVDPENMPDEAYDDIHACELGKINYIVNES